MAIFYCKFKKIGKSYHGVNASSKEEAVKKFIKNSHWKPSDVSVRKTPPKSGNFYPPSRT